MSYLVFLLALVFACVCGNAGDARAAEGQAYTLSAGGLDRSYLLYRPASLNTGSAVPLVIMLHGGFGSGTQAERAYKWDAEADRNGFIVAYPDGINRAWNAGGTCCGAAAREGVDDIGFIDKLIATLIQKENVDPVRVYLTGMSNGAAMAYRYGCAGHYPIAAIGGVSGAFSAVCPRPHAVSVIEIHGLADQHIPIEGGTGTKGVTSTSWIAVREMLNSFAAVDGCQTSSTRQQGIVSFTTSTCAKDYDVSLITIEGAGHQWPGSQPKNAAIAGILGSDPPSTALDATDTLWNFFQKHQAQR